MDKRQNKEARDFLLRARRLDERIAELEVSARCAWELETSTTSQLSGVVVQTSGERRPGESYSALADEIAREKVRLNHIKADILKTIREVDDNALARLLIAYYVNGKSWEQVAVDMNYSFRHVTRLNKRAVAVVQGILEGKNSGVV